MTEVQQTLSLKFDEEQSVCRSCWYYHNRVLDGVRVINCIIYGYRKDIIENPDCKPAYCNSWESDAVNTKKLLEGL